MTQHLDHQQLCDVLLEEAVPDHEVALSSGQRVSDREHLDSCLICAAELQFLRTSVTGFRDISIAVANRAAARGALQSSFATFEQRPARAYTRPALLWSAAALLFAAVLPLGFYHESPKLFLPDRHVTTASGPTAASAPPIESDEALLEGIDQDLSTAIPTPMQPLAGSTVVGTSDQTPSLQRKN